MKISVLFMILIVLTSSTVFANETIELAIGDWPPYTSETDEKDKLIEIIVTEAFKTEGIDVNYSYYPWKRSYYYVQEGKSDGTFPWNKTEKREKEFNIHKIGIIKDEGVFFHLKNTKFDWNTFEDLKKYRVGVTVGYKAEEIYKEKGIEAQSVATEDLNFKKILKGRIDIYETSKIVGYNLINKLFKPEEAKLFTHHSKIIEENEYFILFSKTSRGKMFSERFDSGLKKIKESGIYDEILAEYLGPK